MTTIRRWIAAAAAAGAIGITLLAADIDQVLGGVLAGAGAGAVPAIVVLDRRTARIDQERAALAASREQYDAAFAVLAGQRQRILATVERMANSRIAAERADADRRVVRARADGYVEGATAVLTGKFEPTDTPSEGADVVSLADRRGTPVTTR